MSIDRNDDIHMDEYVYIYDRISIEDIDIGDTSGWTGNRFSNGSMTVVFDAVYNVDQDVLSLEMDECYVFMIDQDGEVIKEIDNFELTKSQYDAAKDKAQEEFFRLNK